jgi:topoisomerase-4 subunit B
MNSSWGMDSKVDIKVEDGVVSVRDYGRGIPHGKLVDCVSTINTGAKYNDEVFQFSVGLNGVGTKAVNALAASFTVRSYREGKYAEAVFEKGKLTEENSGKALNEPDGTFVNFLPDDAIFPDFQFKDDHIIRRLKLYTYLNAGLTLVYNGQAFVSQGGLLDLIRTETDDEAVYEPLHYRSKMLEIAFTHCQRFNETHFSFVNGQYTSDGGTHLSAFREGMLKAVNEFSKKKYEGDDVREGMVGAIAIRLKDPIFESQTKNKLGNSEIRGDLVNQVKDAVLDLLHRNPEVAERLLLKVQDTERLRKELQSVKKMARERAKAISLRIPQLKDCKQHLDLKRGRGEDSMIFITEGSPPPVRS